MAKEKTFWHALSTRRKWGKGVLHLWRHSPFNSGYVVSACGLIRAAEGKTEAEVRLRRCKNCLRAIEA